MSCRFQLEFDFLPAAMRALLFMQVEVLAVRFDGLTFQDRCLFIPKALFLRR
jgi:hypothetical protein